MEDYISRLTNALEKGKPDKERTQRLRDSIIQSKDISEFAKGIMLAMIDDYRMHNKL
jgi:hypothetical protein